jgi:hypothetical protein
MELIIAACIAVAAAFGAASKDGLLKKGSDTTRQETYAFERQALEGKLARLESKQRVVYEIGEAPGSDAKQVARLNLKREKLRERITALKQAESSSNSVN